MYFMQKFRNYVGVVIVNISSLPGKNCSPLLHLYNSQSKSGMHCMMSLNACNNRCTHDVCRMGCDLCLLYSRIVRVMYSGYLPRISRCFLLAKSLKTRWNRSVGTTERAINCRSEISLETQPARSCPHQAAPYSTAVSSSTAAPA